MKEGAEASQPPQREVDCGEIEQQRLEPEWPSMPEWRPRSECARPLPLSVRRCNPARSLEHQQYGQDDRQVVIHAEQTNYSLDAARAREIDGRAERLAIK